MTTDWLRWWLAWRSALPVVWGQGWGQLLFSITNTITITALHNFSITIIITITIIQIFKLQIQLQF